jgi:hypothetical protein
MIPRLRRTRKFEVVPDPKNADTEIRRAGRIWVTGHVTTNPRSHLSRPTFGGFLSVEVVGKNGETLWSYLVSASQVFWDDIIDDLAGQVVHKLVLAHAGRIARQPAVVHQKNASERSRRCFVSNP